MTKKIYFIDIETMGYSEEDSIGYFKEAAIVVRGNKAQAEIKYYHNSDESAFDNFVSSIKSALKAKSEIWVWDPWAIKAIKSFLKDSSNEYKYDNIHVAKDLYWKSNKTISELTKFVSSKHKAFAINDAFDLHDFVSVFNNDNRVVFKGDSSKECSVTLPLAAKRIFLFSDMPAYEIPRSADIRDYDITTVDTYSDVKIMTQSTGNTVTFE